MRKSIRWQVTIVFISLVGIILLAAMFINNQFLEEYYIRDKQDTLIEMYEKIEYAIENNLINDQDTKQEMEEMVEKENLSMIVTDQNYSLIVTAAPNERKIEEMCSMLIGRIWDHPIVETRILVREENYQIHCSQDRMDGAEYIEMWGGMRKGGFFLIRTPLESIRDNVNVANEFLFYIILAMIVVGSFLVWVLAKRITDPIGELAELSKGMANMDFNAKYTSGGNNEIGVLGQNFNVMSEKLEQAIASLKNANYELQKDIERKEKIENMRTEFIGNVSHELKTPIALIQGYAEGLKEGISDDPEDQKYYCEVIMDEANKMNQLVRGLLTLNQLELGKEEIEFKRFNIAELIEGVVQSCEIFTQQKGINIHFAKEQTVYVWADEFKAEQVLRNYLQNALNHVEGENYIEISLEECKEQGKAHVTVFNTGKQIPEEDIDQIWNKFYKVDKAHTREYGGNGIGLSIVKAIMDSFDNAYGVENRENGVAFWFELDLR